MKLSSKALACGQSPMRKFHPYAVAAAAAGKKIYHLNIGQPDIHTPDALYDAIHNFRTPVLAYAASPGIPELISAIEGYYRNIGVQLSESDILVTTGGSEALQIAANCLLDDGDEVVSAAVAAEGKSLLTVTENGYGKRTAVEAYLRGEDRQPQTRGGKGLRNYRLTGKTGLVAGAAIVDDTNDVMLIESGGVVLRTPAASINLYGRDTQGVILMRIEEGNRVIGVEAISNTEE